MKNKGFTIIKGDLPILISAPHAYPHKRPNLSNSYKAAEGWTDYLCEQISLDTGAWGIFSTDLLDYDPNYHPVDRNVYKQEIAKILSAHNIKYFIDLHGLSEKHEYDIGSYYAQRFSKSRRLADEVQKILNKGSLKGLNFKMLNFLENDQESLGEYVVHNFKVPAIQIEIARYIREDSILREDLLKNFQKELIGLNI